MFSASTFTLGIGDLIAIIGTVAGASAAIFLKLASLKTEIERATRKHEARCYAFDPKGKGTAPRGVAIPPDLKDTVT